MKKIFSILVVLLSVTLSAQEVKKQILSEGEGPEARPSDEVVITYVLTQIDQNKKSTLIENIKSPLKIVLDDKKLISGLYQGLIGTKKGQKIILEIPPELAYGNKGEGEIKPNASLRYEISR